MIVPLICKQPCGEQQYGNAPVCENVIAFEVVLKRPVFHENADVDAQPIEPAVHEVDE